MARLEFFYDCGSPWTYLAFHRVLPLAEEAGAELIFRPILVGGVFNEVNASVYQQRSNPVPAKARYYRKDLADWARHCGLAIGNPSIFPINSVKAMRGALVAETEGLLVPWSRRVFEAYWGEDRDIASDAVLAELARDVGLEPSALLENIGEPAVKDRLRANTSELIERGGFGSPTMFVGGDDVYFGNDRLELVRAALGRGRASRV